MTWPARALPLFGMLTSVLSCVRSPPSQSRPSNRSFEPGVSAYLATDAESDAASLRSEDADASAESQSEAKSHDGGTLLDRLQPCGVDGEVVGSINAPSVGELYRVKAANGEQLARLYDEAQPQCEMFDVSKPAQQSIVGRFDGVRARVQARLYESSQGQMGNGLVVFGPDAKHPIYAASLLACGAESTLAAITLWPNRDALQVKCWSSCGAACFHEQTVLIAIVNGAAKTLFSQPTGTYEGPAPDEAARGVKPKFPAGYVRLVRKGPTPTLRASVSTDSDTFVIKTFEWDASNERFEQATPTSGRHGGSAH